ncbi:MAG: serine/threonine protein kinase [Candidatus Obscuribacterales bacterium]|nr:serine/threonine protein kinase [Candidatus Obscuribacterales bacterium]
MKRRLLDEARLPEISEGTLIVPYGVRRQFGILREHRANLSPQARRSIYKYCFLYLTGIVGLQFASYLLFRASNIDILSLTKMIGFLGYIGNIPATFVLALLAVCLCTLAYEFRYPTHLEFGPNGMRLHWLYFFGRKSSEYMPWNAVAYISSLSKTTMIDGLPYNELRISIPRSEIPLASSHLLKFASEDYRFPFTFKWKENMELTFRDTMFCRENDSAIVVDALTSLVDADKIDPSTASFVRKNDCDFTELWLDRLTVGGDRLDSLEPGDLVDRRYRIVRRIGSGGQAVAYISEDLSSSPIMTASESDASGAGLLQSDSISNYDASGLKQAEVLKNMTSLPSPIESARLVVLKEFVLPITGGREVTQEALRRIQQEARLIQSLDHPQIVKCYELLCEGRRAYLVQNLIEGNSLESIVKAKGPFPEEQVIVMAIGMCGVLEYLHGRTPPVVHRDFTPDNLMLSDDGMLTLIDFNVAKQLEAGDATHTVVGKHSYIPAEQFRGDSSPQSDLYAMGGVLYFLLTGQEPEPISVARPRDVCPSVSQSLNHVVGKCTQQRLDCRFKSASELKEALQSIRSTVAVD